MTDHQLMMNVRDGDRGSLGVLFDRHHHALYNYFLKHTGNPAASEDLVQDLFLRLMKYRGSYADTGGFTVWLYRIARNLRFDHYRRREPEHLDPEEAGRIPDEREGADRALERAEEAGRVARALSLLDDDDREVLVLSKYREMKYKDIGEVLGCSEGAVKVRVFRALREFAKIYETLERENVNEL